MKIDKPSLEVERKLAEYVGTFRYDPLGFVMNLFPWGQKGTTLADKKGPEPWQRDFLIEMGRHRQEQYWRKEMGLDRIPFQAAVASGHGVGKSALFAWITLFLMSTSPLCRGVITANTGTQLETRTWPELAKWLNLLLNKHWFVWTASSIYFAASPEDERKNYMVNATTVSEDNTEAFAGLHNETSAVLIGMDEASGIASKIFEVAEGAATDGEVFFVLFGNPTRPDGRFAEIFMEPERYPGWYRRHVDSREVSHTNKTVLEERIARYGIDSDYVRVRVLGKFPSKAYDGFISQGDLTLARTRECHHNSSAPLILGIDVARFGDDETVFFFRRGADARSIPIFRFRGLDTVEIARRAVQQMTRYRPDHVVVESTGPGAGVIDNLRAWGHRGIHGIHPGSKASDDQHFQNLRAEMWQKLSDAIHVDLCLPNEPELERQLVSIKYAFNGTANRLMLEAKKDLKDRGEPSPDLADALALTFALPFAKKEVRDARPGAGLRGMSDIDYDVLGFGMGRPPAEDAQWLG